MKLIDKHALASFRGCLCEWCGLREFAEAHHIYGKGAGRVDIRENLIGLDRFCHAAVHNGHITRGELLAKAAAREGVLQDAITRAVHAIRRLDKHDHAGAQAILSSLRKRADDRPGREADELPPGDVGSAPAVRPAGLPAEQTVQGWRTF